jgi:hypothetical protein
MQVDHLLASLDADLPKTFSAAKEAGLSMTPGVFRKRTRVPGKHASDARDEGKSDGAWLAATTACLTFATAVVTLIVTLLGLQYLCTSGRVPRVSRRPVGEGRHRRITVRRAPTITLAAYRPRNDPDLSPTRRHPGGLDPERSSALTRSGQIGPPRAPPGTQMRQGQPGSAAYGGHRRS